MSNITRAKAVIDALRNADTPNAQLSRIIDRFVDHARASIIEMELDPDTLTNNQKAAVFLRVMTDYGKKIVKRQARQAAEISVEDTIDTAVNDAENDLD